MTGLQRFEAKFTKTTGCWLWTGHSRRSKPNGGLYGSFSLNGRSTGAHRASWEIYRGPIPKGLVIDHLCRITLCVNPDHLEPVTNRENVLRGVGPSAVHAGKKLCIRGHEMRIRIRNGRIERQCETCNALKKRERIDSRRALSGKSGFRGVNLHYGRYEARIKIAGKRFALGSFDSGKEASLAYEAALAKVRPEAR